MDYKKDTEISFGSQNSKNAIVFKLFEKDNYLLFIYKKIERIVSALYLVSNLLSESEPVRWQFRNVGIGAISQLLSLTSNPLSKSEVFYKLTTDLVRLLSLLDVSYVAGLVSEMNFSLLKKELEQLLETLNVKDVLIPPQVGKKGLLNREFFAVPMDQLNQDKVSQRDPLSSAYPSFPEGNPEKSEGTVQTWSDVDRAIHRTPKRHHKGQYIKDTNSSTQSSTAEKFEDQDTARTQRQTLIIDLLKNKNNLTIKDFSPVIKGCSDKTIQRELLKLVRFGVLKKEGERRWSRYSLAKL